MSRIDILTPSTIEVFAGAPAISSLDELPPYGISISDPAGGTFAVTLVAGSTQAGLSASGADGATISQAQNTLTVTGNQAQVNAALASLQIDESLSGTDTLSITVNDSLSRSAGTTFAIDVLPTIGPAYVGPPLELTIAPDALDAIGGLVLSDAFESGLASMGFGSGISVAGTGVEGTLRVILTVGNGVLLLPGFDPAGGIAADGLGTGTIVLTCDANELPVLNTLLAGLDYVGPAGEDELEFSAQDLVNGQAFDGTYSRLFLRLKGTQGTAKTLVAGDQTLGLAGASLGGVLSVTGDLVMQSTAASAVTLGVAPGASLDVTASTLTLAGTSLDYGALSAPLLDVVGTLLVADGMSLAGPLVIGTAGDVAASGLVNVFGGETLDDALALSLAAGAVFDGNGTLMTGNFSGAGLISGPGTILANTGATLAVLADSITGGAVLEVADGAVMVLGSLDSLYGIFNDAPVTIDSSVTLAFSTAVAAVPVTGIYADTLGGEGGAFVIEDPTDFNATIVGFAPGDQLIFPNYPGINVISQTSTSFVLAGEPNGVTNTPTITIFADIPAGYAVASQVDTAADPSDEGGLPDVFLRLAAATITVPEVYLATSGTAQPLEALQLELSAETSLSIALTLAVQHGTLREGSLSGAKITIAAANLAAVNERLAGLAYSGTGVNDTVTITSNSGLLSGFDDFVPVETALGGNVNAYSGLAFTEAQAAAFAPHAGLYEQILPVAAGEAVVTGAVSFDAPVQDNGLSGTSLLVDDGGDAIFAVAAQVTLLAGTTIGDAGGAGTLAILGTDFVEAGNFVVAASALGAGSVADVLGSLGITGSLAVGAAGQADLTVLGTLAGQAASVGSAGTILAAQAAQLSLTALSDAGLVVLENAASLSLGSLAVTGQLTIGGAATVAASGAVSVATGGALSLGADAVLDAGSLADAGTLQLAGLASLAGTMALTGPVSLAGGTILAGAMLESGTLAGHGVVVAPTIVNSADIFVAGGVLVLAGSFANGGLVAIENTGALDLAGSASGAALSFTGTNALLTVNDPLDASIGVSGMQAGDAIDLVGVTPSLVSFAAGAVTITNSAGQALSIFALDQATTTGVTVVSDRAGGAEVTIDGQLPCFARGTRLLTPQGYRAVETLTPGDPVITAAGAKRPVRWVGWRTLDFRGGRFAAAMPVSIEAGAFGPGVPARAVVLSPQHAVCVPGGLIPVGHLVNGVTVRRLPASAATYYHVELDRHDALLAEGLPCESYFDDGNRGGLYREIGRRHPAPRPMAPYMTAGSRVTLLRRQLHERTLAMGYAPTFAPRLSVVADGVQVDAQIDEARVAHIRLPRPARRLTLISPAAAAAETDPGTDDWRAVSLCWAPAAGVRFGAGFYERAAGDRGVWMGARGEVTLRREAATIALNIAAVAQRWGRL